MQFPFIYYGMALCNGGFRGGGAHPETFLYICPPPPFCTCASPPFWNLKKKKTEMCRRIPPPPRAPFGTCATLDAGGAPKKKVSESPPPPAHQLFWDLRDFRGWRRSEKKKKCVVPPFFKNPGSVPGTMYKRQYTDKTLTLWKSTYMRASELRKFWHFYIIKVLFLLIWMGRNNYLQINI